MLICKIRQYEIGCTENIHKLFNGIAFIKSETQMKSKAKRQRYLLLCECIAFECDQVVFSHSTLYHIYTQNTENNIINGWNGLS